MSYIDDLFSGIDLTDLFTVREIPSFSKMNRFNINLFYVNELLAKYDQAAQISQLDGSNNPTEVKIRTFSTGLLRDRITVSDAGVNFNNHQAINFIIENRISDPGAPVTGQMWLRTDIAP